jgi:transcriptional regulator with XRE-family HTH domain
MPQTLGQVLRQARKRNHWTLREAEAATGIHNAHLSQIETSTITQPGQAVLWSLAEAYGLEFKRLLKLAGHTTANRRLAGRQSLAGAVLRGLQDLDDEEQEQLLAQLEELRRNKRG